MNTHVPSLFRALPTCRSSHLYRAVGWKGLERARFEWRGQRFFRRSSKDISHINKRANLREPCQFATTTRAPWFCSVWSNRDESFPRIYRARVGLCLIPFLNTSTESAVHVCNSINATRGKNCTDVCVQIGAIIYKLFDYWVWWKHCYLSAP